MMMATTDAIWVCYCNTQLRVNHEFRIIMIKQMVEAKAKKKKTQNTKQRANETRKRKWCAFIECFIVGAYAVTEKRDTSRKK